jgi:endonuclease/exonuclease/phosphatase family metal-dependent hydrolase
LFFGLSAGASCANANETCSATEGDDDFTAEEEAEAMRLELLQRAHLRSRNTASPSPDPSEDGEEAWLGSAEEIADEDEEDITLQARQAPPPEQLTMISYNLYWWNVVMKHRFGNINDRIKKAKQGYNLDLIGFQECEDVDRIVHGAELEGFDFYQGPNKQWANPAPLAWNAQVFEKLDGPDYKIVAHDRYGARVLTWVRLKHKHTGTTIFFGNTHGPLGNCGWTLGRNWMDGVTENRQPGDLSFIMGDFNCMTGTPAMQKLHENFPYRVDAGIDQIMSDVLDAEWGDGKSGSKCGWPSDHPLVKATFTLTKLGPPLQCEDYGKWPNLDNGVTCRNCTALVIAKHYGGRCDTYCESFGHVCMGAWEEAFEGCGIKSVHTCNEVIGGTSDILCQCSNAGHLLTTSTTTTTTITTVTTTTFTTVTGKPATAIIQPDPVDALYSGDTIYLKASNGMHVTVEPNSFTHAFWNQRGTWQGFKVHKDPDDGTALRQGDAVFLEAHTGKYLLVRKGHVNATGDERKERCRLLVEKQQSDNNNDPQLFDGDTIFLMAQTGKFVSVENALVLAHYNKLMPEEGFILESDNGTARKAKGETSRS